MSYNENWSLKSGVLCYTSDHQMDKIHSQNDLRKPVYCQLVVSLWTNFQLIEPVSGHSIWVKITSRTGINLI